MPEHLLIYLCIGCLAGFLSGMLGIGGGIIVVPGLAFVFQHTFGSHLMLLFASGSSLMVMIATSASSIVSHHKFNGVDWHILPLLVPGIVLGVICGAMLANFIDVYWVKKFFGIFIILIVLRIFLLKKITSKTHLPRNPWRFLITYIIGLKSGLFGVGGGSIIIPFLTYCGVPMRKASGLSISCTLPIAITGSISFIILGLKQHVNIVHATGYVYWPAVICVALGSVVSAPLGTKLASHINIEMLKKIFGVVLLITGLKLLI
jgi:uncharacterized protein